MEELWARQFNDKRDWERGKFHGCSSRNPFGFDRGRMENKGKRLELAFLREMILLGSFSRQNATSLSMRSYKERKSLLLLCVWRGRP